MAFTRKMLKAMGIDEEKIDEIIEAHLEVTNVLKEKADKLDIVQKQLDDTLIAAKNSGEGKVDKKDYDALKKQFDDFKADTVAAKARQDKAKAYRELLKSEGIGEKWIDRALKFSNLDDIKLDESGKPLDEEKLRGQIKADFSDLIESTGKTGAAVADPPNRQSAKTFTRDDIRKMSPKEINDNYESILQSLQNKERMN